MIPSIKPVIIATGVLVALDLMWIGWLMAPFYQSRLRPLLNFVDGTLHPRIIPTVLTYVTMILIVSCIAVPLARTYAGDSNFMTFLIGAFVGLVVYGLYNLTNLSLIKDWSTAVTVVDTLWGGVIFGVSTLLVWFFD